MKTEEDMQPVRVNGFGRPFHPLQVLSWVVSAVDVTVYAFVGLPLVEPNTAMIFVALCYGVSVIVMVLGAARATGCDPTDPRVHGSHEVMDPEAEESDDLPYCPICEATVETRSKHCRTCNKCVDIFDHHCMWLNNCVGRANYRAFFVTVCAVAVMTGILLGTCVYLLIDYFLDEEVFEQRAQSIIIFRSAPRELLLGLTITLTVVNAPLFLLDLQLVLLHLFLMSQHLTTYEYIVNKQDRLEGREDSKDAGEGGMKPEKPGGARRFAKRIRTLPRCMDWIVFCRCGQRRKRRQARSLSINFEEASPAPQQEPEEHPGPEVASESEACSGGATSGTASSATSAASASAVAMRPGTPEPEAPEPEEEHCCEHPVKDCELFTTDTPPPQLAADVCSPGKPASVLPQQRQLPQQLQHRQQVGAKEDGNGCSAYSGIAVMWRFILGLGRTSLTT